MPITSFRDLIVWQKSFVLAKDVYAYTRQLPKTELYGLSSQLQRCAVSIPSNIAGGQQRNNSKEYRQFLGIAEGSATELETQLLLAGEIYTLSNGQLLLTLNEVQRMLAALYKKLEPNI